MPKLVRPLRYLYGTKFSEWPEVLKKPFFDEQPLTIMRAVVSLDAGVIDLNVLGMRIGYEQAAARDVADAHQPAEGFLFLLRILVEQVFERSLDALVGRLIG